MLNRMLNKKNLSIIILVMVLLLCSFSVYSISFSAEITPIKDRIKLGESAEFKLTIFNYEPSTLVFRVKSADYPRWGVNIHPLENPILMEVKPKSNASIVLYVDPNNNYIGQIGSHFVNINVISESGGETRTLQARVGLVKTDEPIKEYVPTIILNTDLPEKINPSLQLDFSITLSNQNNLNLSGAKLIINSNFINKEIKLDILPKEKKVIDIKQQLDPKTKPTKDKLTVRLLYKDQDVFTPFEKEYEIVPYVLINDESTKSGFFLKKTENIVLINKGNVRFKGEYTVPVKPFRRFFTSTKPESSVVKRDGEKVYAWYVEIEPDESYSVRIVESYLGIVFFLVIILIIAGIIYLNKSPIFIKKQIKEPEIHQGGLSRLKVLMTVKNRSLRKITEISIVDKIPKLLEIEKHTTIGSLKPAKIKKNKNLETLILWTIEELTPGEERVISYHLKSELNILGCLSLQPAACKFRDNGKEVKIRSDRAFVRG